MQDENVAALSFKTAEMKAWSSKYHILFLASVELILFEHFMHES